MTTQPRTTARSRTRARRQRERERTPAYAVTLSIIVVFAVALLSTLVVCNIPGTALFNFVRGMQADVPLSPTSVLYGQLLTQIEYQDYLFFTPFSLLFGGLALGRLIPTQFSRFRLLRIASAVSAGVLAACLLFRWGLILIGQHGHLRAGEVTTQLEMTQTACTVGWVVAYLLGTLIGVIWRDHRRSGHGKPPAVSGLPTA